jgi:hypothetical protein
MFRLFVFRLFSDGFVVDILDREETINKGHPQIKYYFSIKSIIYIRTFSNFNIVCINNYFCKKIIFKMKSAFIIFIYSHLLID